jgi:PAS domain S-box-containing protein
VSAETHWDSNTRHEIFVVRIRYLLLIVTKRNVFANRLTTSMQTSRPGYQGPDRPTPLWFLASSLVLVGVAICLLLLSLGSRVYVMGLSPLVFFAALLALACTVFLHLRFFWKQEKEYQETATTLYATDREYRSIFEHALDAIIILDNEGVCLDTNPAALVLLGVPRAGLIGTSFARFHSDPMKFEREWQTFLEQNYRRGQAALVRADGSRLVVYYTAAANYLPGRHVIILCDATERVLAQASLEESQHRFRQMAENIQEIFWMMNARTKEVLYVNPAYETITGRSVESLLDNLSSYADLIHSSDRVPVLAKLEAAVHSGQFNEEFRIVRPDAAVRWVWVKAFPVRDDNGALRSLVGTVQDITARKIADGQVAEHLAVAETARAEAEALRKATLSLTQNLRMDAVLDTLLHCLSELLPYDSASVILTEADSRLFVAREAPYAQARKRVVTLDAKENRLLERVLLARKSAFVPDTRDEAEWSETKAVEHIRCWLGVPLVTSDCVLGLLSIGSTEARKFTPEHLRLAKSLAIPAAVAIHNARLYEWAEIYAAERESLLKKSDGARRASAEERDRPLPH